MLNNSCIRNLSVCIIYHSISLIIIHIQNFCFKAHRTILQCSQLISEILVNHSCKYHFIRYIFILFSECKIIRIGFYLYTFQHFFYNRCISALWYSLINIIKIIIVISKAEGKPFDNKCRKLCTRTSPLLFCISLYQLFINICSR